jgi:Protein of unknown function (DUF2442)
MNTSERRPGERVRDVRFTEDVLVVDLLDGRTISVPLVWYPRLLSATPEQRANWRVAGGGFGIQWPDVDEDLSTVGLLRRAGSARLRAERSGNRRLTQAVKARQGSRIGQIFADGRQIDAALRLAVRSYRVGARSGARRKDSP